jgi:hypothetical protein
MSQRRSPHPHEPWREFLQRWVTAIAALVIACSDASGDAESIDACEPIEPCGGDLVGTWRIESSCPSATEAQAIDTLAEELPPECSGALQSAESDASNLSLVFDASGTVSITGAMSLRLRYTYDEACFAAMFGTLGSADAASCRQLGPGMMGAMEAGPLGVAACSFEAGVCACEFFFEPDVSASSAYTPADGRVTIDDQSLAYCVSGDRLHIGLPSVGASVARRQ